MSGPPRRGRFIVLEGGEGAGKSTLLASLASRFAEAGVHAVTAREPGGTAAGERIRDLLHEALTPWAEAFAFLAARAELVERVIRPALEDGAVVICDRFGASTLAYQGYGRGLDLATLRAAHAAATGGLEPDLTIYLDVDPGAGLARKGGDQDGLRVGREALAFHQRVREGYQALAREAPAGAWITIDASQSTATVEAAAWGAAKTLP